MEAIAIPEAPQNLEAHAKTGIPWDRITALAVSGLGTTLLVGGTILTITHPETRLPSAAAALTGLATTLSGLLLHHLTTQTHRRNLEFEGLVEEISQELDKVNHRNDLLGDALTNTDMRLARLTDRIRRQEREQQPVTLRK